MGNSGKAPDSRDDCEGPCSECQGPEDPKPLRDIEDLKPKQGTVAYWDPLRSQVIRIGRVRRMPQHRLAQVQAAEARQAPEVPQAAEAPQEAQEELENRGENNEAVKLWLETLPDSIPPPEDNTPEDLADNLPGIGDKIINYAALSSSDSDSSYGEYDKTHNSPMVSNPEEFAGQDRATMNVQGHLFPLPPTGGVPYTAETTGQDPTFSGLASLASNSTGKRQDGQDTQGSKATRSEDDAISGSVNFILGSDESESGKDSKKDDQKDSDDDSKGGVRADIDIDPTHKDEKALSKGKEQPTASNPQAPGQQTACSSSDDAQGDSSGGGSKKMP